MTTERELLPCPFCGTTPILHDPLDTGHQPVECPNESCCMSKTWPDVVQWQARAALAQPAQPVAKKIDMHSLRVLANAMHKVAPHVVDEFINCAVEALSKESEHDNQSDSGCTRGMAGEGNQDGACTGSDVSRTGIGGSGASERESGLLRSRAPEDTGGGNAEGIAAPQPAPAQETKV